MLWILSANILIKIIIAGPKVTGKDKFPGFLRTFIRFGETSLTDNKIPGKVPVTFSINRV